MTWAFGDATRWHQQVAVRHPRRAAIEKYAADIIAKEQAAPPLDGPLGVVAAVS